MLLAEKCHMNLESFRMWIKLSKKLKVLALDSCLLAELCEETDAEQCLPSHRVTCFLLGDHRPEFLSYETHSRVLQEKVVTSSRFQQHRMGHKMCYWSELFNLLNGLNLSSAENDKCYIQSQNGITGAASELWKLWHVSNISRDFHRDWTFFLLAGEGSSNSALSITLSTTSQAQRPQPGKWWLWPAVNKLHPPCPCYMRSTDTANDESLMCLRQLPLSRCGMVCI